MSACCETTKDRENQVSRCKECGNTGKPVKRITLTHLLREEKVPYIRDVSYFFCPTPDCDVVYFPDAGEAFYTADLKVRVGIKETEPPIPVCYCYGYTRDMIQDDLIQNGRSTIREIIARKTKTGSCQCEIRNPQGSCCLGEVAGIIKDSYPSLSGQ